MAEEAVWMLIGKLELQEVIRGQTQREPSDHLGRDVSSSSG